METAFIVFAFVSPIALATAQVIICGIILRKPDVKWQDKIRAIHKILKT